MLLAAVVTINGHNRLLTGSVDVLYVSCQLGTLAHRAVGLDTAEVLCTVAGSHVEQGTPDERSLVTRREQAGG